MAEQPKATGGQPYQSTGVSNTPVEARPNTLEVAPELTGHGLPLSKCEAYNRVYDQPYESN